MNTFFRPLLHLYLLGCLPGPALAAAVFQDGFESGSLGPAWTVSTSNDGRGLVSTNYGPATGQWHLVLDDRESDTLYSVAEATLQVDLSNKKDVLLSFKAKSLGNEPDYPGFRPIGSRAFDGVSFSTDGGATWQVVQSLATVGTEWESFSILLDAYVFSPFRGNGFGADFRIRFSEYDNASAPLDGIAIDDVLVSAEDDQRAVLELPNFLIEGTGPHTGYVLLAFPPTNTLTLSLTGSPPGQLILPATVDVPAGQIEVSFNFSVADDTLVNLERTVSATATAPGVTAIPTFVTLLDDDAPVVRLTLPVQLVEGEFPSENASLSLDRAPDVPMTINLTASLWSEISVPSGVTIPAGATQTVFTVQAYDDDRIDGNVAVTVTASRLGMPPVTAQTTIVDNESRALSMTLPATVQEAATATGTVTMSGTLPTALDVHLNSSDPVALTVPASLTIPGGQTQATFAFTARDNAVRDGSRVVRIDATADTFTGTNRAVTIRDDEADAYRISALTDIVNLSSPVSITVSAVDLEGNVIGGFAGPVSLNLVLRDGTLQPVTPFSVTLSGATGWTGNVTIPDVDATPLRLRATDDSGNSGESIAFDIMRVLDLTVADLAWDPTRNQIYASVPASAGGTNANKVIVIDPVNGRISNSVLTGQDPGQLALTGGGENLYVALNGNGRIARINPTTMEVASSFAVGTSPAYGTLYAADMCTVAGQPDLLVVSQRRTSVTPEHNGVAVYDNGVVRPNKTQDHTGSNRIEPSADPGIFFGYNTESTEFGFRRLRLDASGITEIEVNGNLIGSTVDIRSDGNKVFTTSGVELDGAQMRRLGTFPASGPVCPDLAANRVYFIEPQDPYIFFSGYDKIGAYDPTTFANIRRLTLSSVMIAPRSFIRWGTNGLAFRTETNVVLISSSQLVPSDPPANLAVTLKAAPIPATVSEPLIYTLCVSNQGPNIARSTILGATLSDSQTIQSVVASAGTPATSGLTVTLTIGELASAACVTLTITTLPQSAGNLTCIANVSSRAIDPDFTDNTAAKVVGVAFQSAINTVNQLRLSANNLIYDPTRNRLWASIPSTVALPLGKSVVSIDPTTGIISDPIPINANPAAQCMALSANGRYLYVGLTDSPELLRLDLASGPASVRIPLGPNQWGQAGYAEDIEPLDGDGTSFLVTTYGDNGAAVFDGFVRRSDRTGIYTVDRIERTATSGIFVGYANSISSYRLSRLSVTASGVSISQYVDSLFTGAREIRGAGNLILSSTGTLVDSGNLTLLANLGASGSPCLDLPNQRAYIVSGNILRGYDTVTSLATESFTLPNTLSGDGARSCIRWGLDGFAILGTDGEIYILRWTSTIPASTDANADGISDAWEAAYFGALNVDPAADGDGDGLGNFQEYLFATSPLEASSAPVQVSTATVGGQKALRLVFPRRAGLVPQPYEYVISSDLLQWTVAQDVSETVLSTTHIGDGVQIETVEALIPATNAVSGFVRFRWNPH